MSTITMFQSVTKTDKPHYIDVRAALERIVSGKSMDNILAIRAGNSELKRSLPVALFSGVFATRKDDALESHSGLIVLDFDHVNAEASKALLSTDEYVYACWISPSGEGLKALVRVSNPERHREHFRSLQSYFDSTYGLMADPSGVNESRACFESYDPELVLNENSKVFGGMLKEQQEQQVAQIQELHTDYEKLNIVARMVRRAQDGEKHAILLRAAILCGGYIAAGRMEEDEAERVLVREILKKENVEDPANARKTIRDGIEEGKRMPIRDVIEDEARIRRDMQINDGDMSFISSDDSDYNWIEKFARGEIVRGLTTGFEWLDRFFLFKKEFTIINGHSNVGKTTMAQFLMVSSAVLHGWRWVVYSSENKTASFKMRLMEFLLDKPIDMMRHEERTEAFKWVNKHFTIISNAQVYSYADLMVFAEKLVRQERYDGYLIDPYNSLKITVGKNSTGITSHEYHYEAASEFLTFATQNDMAVWVNTHAITEAVRRKGPDGLPVAPFAEDTEGGGKWVNRADSFVTFHRKVLHPEPEMRYRTEIHVRKVRNTETGGSPTPFDQPVIFQLNNDRTGMYPIFGKKTFSPMYLDSRKIELP
jgi:hypothetical protein